MQVEIEASWKEQLSAEFNQPYFHELVHFLKSEKTAGKEIYPPGKQIFEAFRLTPFDEVKVVIIGQDPYHGPGQAHGLCFSVAEGIRMPPSLQNIFTELNKDTGAALPDSGSLVGWAKQGVLLLNAILTVERGKAGSHHAKGWETFTDSVINLLNAHRSHIVFLLWGNYARLKGKIIDRTKHLVLESGHPSPLSANKGHWFGHSHFSKTNQYLASHLINPINWSKTK